MARTPLLIVKALHLSCHPEIVRLWKENGRHHTNKTKTNSVLFERVVCLELSVLFERVVCVCLLVLFLFVL